jgi:hypothetical protein
LSLVDGLLIALFVSLYVAAFAWDAMARPKRLLSLMAYSMLGSAALLAAAVRTEGFSLAASLRSVILATAVTAAFHFMVWARNAMMQAAFYDAALRRKQTARLRRPRDFAD